MNEARTVADTAFLGLEAAGEDGRFRFVVEDRLARFDGRLYGGTAIAVSITAAEQVTGRSALWMTTQFVATADEGSAIDVRVEVLAPGYRTNQVRVTGTDAAGDAVFASLGATGHHRPDGLAGAFERCPRVAPPGESEVWDSPITGMLRAAGVDVDLPVPTDRGFSALIELRHAEAHEHPDPGPGRLCLWVRRKDGEPITPAMAAFMADMVPMSVARGLQVLAAGTSLDNSIRIGDFVESDWILLDLRPHLAAGGYGHGTALIWGEDGRLLGAASQTASLRPFDLDRPPFPARS